MTEKDPILDDNGQDANIPDFNTEDTNEGASEVEKLQQEVGELKDKYIRQAAEFDNFRRRTSREKLELIQTAGKDVIVSLLDVLDDCDRAEKTLETQEDNPAIREGVQLVFAKLRNTLAAKGLKPMQTIGTEFNPEFHEAITEIPAPAPELAGKVVDEVTRGYYLNDKIIRFAKVVVGK
ncbi:nucleotide exchange factor GrpE [Pseudoflavitalea rhizosphaerae]|uniref:nucleotide exchange factor GrpE n=1 Tax=Pseudoflavitalea rhizosphaerae TaxID=1884793 RepID=UPI000F8F3B85|nr:nucleotide exchange factor GrpE [Pseudoflavitalea rhizosphaerae]